MSAPRCAVCHDTGTAGFRRAAPSWLDPFGRTVLVAVPCRACPLPGAEAVLASPAVRRAGGGA